MFKPIKRDLVGKLEALLNYNNIKIKPPGGIAKLKK